MVPILKQPLAKCWAIVKAPFAKYSCFRYQNPAIVCYNENIFSDSIYHIMLFQCLHEINVFTVYCLHRSVFSPKGKRYEKDLTWNYGGIKRVLKFILIFSNIASSFLHAVLSSKDTYDSILAGALSEQCTYICL